MNATLRFSSSRNQWLALLVAGSLVVLALSVVLELGLAATPYDATDSFGRTLGFNDDLHPQCLPVLARNLHFRQLFRPAQIYTWLLATMECAGIWLLLTSARRSVRRLRAFFAAQFVLFPFGLFFCWLAPLITVNVCAGRFGDRESWTDFPVGPTWFLGQTFWVFTSIILLFTLRGPSLDLSQIWRAFLSVLHTCGRTFVAALH